ncbi:MAG: proline--tRNA ligase [Bacillota bacterium]
MTKALIRTLREAPAEAELTSHKLMVRAGMIKRLSSGIYTYLPLGWRVIKKIEQIIREEMDAVGGQEVGMPVVHPAELWQESGRWQSVGPELVRFKDRWGHDMVLAMTHEEAVTDIAKQYLDSYKQLPVILYQLQTKFRDEPRPRGGLIRVREFIMKDAYSFHRDGEDLDRYYPAMCQAYFNVFRRVGVDVVMVLSDVGMMGGSQAHEFTMLSDAGEDTLVFCDGCGYAANEEVAVIAKTSQESPSGQAPEAEIVATPGCSQVQDVAKLLGIGAEKVMKTMAYAAGEGLVLAVIRGDLEVNERKLMNATCRPDLKPAPEELVRAFGLEPGFLSPVGVTDPRVRVVVDDSVPGAGPMIAGANKRDYHLKNVTFGRDFHGLVADIAKARGGDKCAKCGGTLRIARGIEAGNTFKLGTKYSKSMNATFVDMDGTRKPLVMGCYGIGVGRLFACIVEQHHDERGIVFPMPVAPYEVYLVQLGEDEEMRLVCERLYEELSAKGLEVLYDDRDVSAGVKFNDADLIGIPIRLTVSPKTLANHSVEFKMRKEAHVELIDLEQAVSHVLAMVKAEKDFYYGKRVQYPTVW